LVSHYNGASWKHYTGNELPMINGELSAVDIKGNMVVAVGSINQQALILTGVRR
jgi:hypothetical protein